MTDFQAVIEAWDADGQTGGKHIHPFDPDSRHFWDLGRAQAAQVADYAKPGNGFVIDFGCGIGRLTIPLISMGYDVVAVDASLAMLDGLARRMNADGIDLDSVARFLSDGTDLADLLHGKKADVIVARAVLIHHDYEGTERIVHGLAAALRDGGHLIADWPIGEQHQRRDWIDVTMWDFKHRGEVAARAGLMPVKSGNVSVWRKGKTVLA